MKQIFTFIAALVFAGQVTGQTVMKIYQNNGTVLQIPLSTIDSITYNIAAASSISTSGITNIKSNAAESGGNIPDDGGSPVTARGVCWSTTSGPTIADSKTTDGNGIGSFTSVISGLSANTLYYVRAYSTNIVGTTYGGELTFTTSGQPDTVLISNFDGIGDWKDNIDSIGVSPEATSDSVNNLNEPIPGAYSGANYWKVKGTSNGYYLDGLDINGSFNFSLKDSIVFYAHNLNSPNTRVFVQLIDKKQINGNGEIFSFEILLPPSNSWVRFAVGINQLVSWQYQPDYSDPGMTHMYYPNLAGVEKINLMINSVDATDTIEVDFDDIQIIRVP